MGLRSRSFFAGVSVAAFAIIAASGVQANDSVVKAVSDPNGWAIAAAATPQAEIKASPP
jgi:hypothetical protein